MSELLTIGEVAARVGVRASALRYYEEAGLLAPAARVSGRRRYDAAAVERLLVIRFAQALGFSLAEIRRLLTDPRGRTQKLRWRELVDAKLDELEATASRVAAMKSILARSRDCDCVDLEHCHLVLEAATSAGRPS